MMTSPQHLIIFGTGQIAELAWFYFVHDSAYTPVAFAVDRAYKDRETLQGLPVVSFEELPLHYPPEQYRVFVAVSYARLNALRAEKVAQARQMGYKLATYVSSRATVFPGFTPGDNCFILEDNTIQPFVRIGENVTLWSGNHIGHHAVIENDCFLASHVVISGGVTVGERTFIGVNATIRDHVRIGARCVIGAGAFIGADVEPEGVYAAPMTERSRVPSSRLRRL